MQQREERSGLGRQLAPKQLALKREGFLAQRAHEAGNGLAREAPTVHAVDPVRIEAGDSIDDVTHGILVGEDPN
jgi:hypothetical protein